MKRNSIICLLIVIVLIFSGCSATAINDTLKDSNNESKVDVEQTVIGKYVESESETEISKSDTEKDDEKGIGEELDASIDIERPDGTKETIGAKGLRYTINSFEIYDNWWETGLELNSDMLGYDFETGEYSLTEGSKEIYTVNKCIIVDITATYNAPKGGREEVEFHPASEIVPMTKKDDQWNDEFVSLRKQDILVVYPQIRYLSTVPPPEKGVYIDDDIKLAVFLKDGETLNFQIGIFCWEGFIEYKDILLQMSNINPDSIEGYDGVYFNFFPEE